MYVAQWPNKIEGWLNVEVDPRNIVMRFYMLLGSLASSDVSSLTDGSVYKHIISDYVCSYKSVTIENKKGWCELSTDKTNIIVQRSFGVVPNSSKMTISSKNIVKLENVLKAQGMFDVAFLFANEKVEASTKAITSATPTNGLLRLVTATHGLVVNDLVKVAGNSVTAYNGYWKVITVVNSTTVDVDCTVSSTVGTGGTVNQISMTYCGERTVRGLIAGDTIRYTNSLGNTEDVVTKYIDADNDVIGNDLITSTAMTVANQTKVELVQQTATLVSTDFFSFSNVSLKRGADVTTALTAAPIDFEQIVLTFDKNVEEIIQNKKNIATPTGLDVKVEIDKAYEDNVDRDAQRRVSSNAYVLQFDMAKIVSATDTLNQTYRMQIIFPEVVSETYVITDKSSEVIKAKLTGIAKYSFSNSYSTQVVVINDQAWTQYTG